MSRVRQMGQRGRAWLLGLCLSVLACHPSFAFDSETWLGKRELLAREAERLRAVYRQCAGSLQTPAENVTLPVETFDDGSVRVMVFAKKAQYFLDKGLVWGEGVTVRRFKEDGSVESIIKAETCVVDRNSRSGWAEGAASVTHGQTTFSGKGVYFSASDGYVRVLEDSRMESANVGEKGESARVSGRTADLDRQAGVAMFENGVVVRYANEYTMCADRLFAFLVGSNELSRVVALRSVSITNESRVGTCAMATYRRKKDMIEMFGDDKGTLARLVDGAEAANALEGRRIRFWPGKELVEVEGARITSEKKEGSGLL